jgi:hypothetical protein
MTIRGAAPVKPALPAFHWSQAREREWIVHSVDRSRVTIQFNRESTRMNANFGHAPPASLKISVD